MSLFLLVSVLFLFTGCSYDDPNDQDLMDPGTAEELINGASLNLSFLEADAGRLAGVWTGQFTSGERPGIVAFEPSLVQAERFDPIWEVIYLEGYTPALLAEAAADLENDPVAAGVAKILQAHYLGEAALLFGDVPYTQAADPFNFPDPVYDPQSSVILAAISLLEEGAAVVGQTPVVDYNSVFNSTATWQQFALALQARYYLALRNYPQALMAAQSADLNMADQEIAIRHDSMEGAFNLYHAFTIRNRSGYLYLQDNYLLELLDADDPGNRSDAKTVDSTRLSHFYIDTGIEEILNATNDGYFAADADYPIISIPEVQLIIAEAAFRTDDVPTAIAALNRARNYWDDKLGVDDYQDYTAADFTNPSDELLRAILIEKFVSVFGVPTMYDLARTDNFINSTIHGEAELPQRFLYSEEERNENANFPGVHRVFDPTPINQ